MNTPKQSNKFMFFCLVFIEALPLVVSLICWLLKMNGIIDNEDLYMISYKSSLYGELITMLVPVIFIMAVKKIPLKKFAPLNRFSFKNAVSIIIITLLLMPTVSFVSSIAHFFVENSTNEAIAELVSNIGAAEALLSFAVIPAVCEELVFRGVILTGYKKINMFKAVAVTALFFGMIHMDVFQLVYTVVIGFAFGIFVYCTNSIFAGMFAHFVFNGLQVLGQILYFKFADPETVKETFTNVMTLQEKVVSLVMSVILTAITLPIAIKLIKRFISRNQNTMLEYKNGTGAESSNTETAAGEADCKIIEKFFVLSILLYLVEMFVNQFLF